MKTFLPYLLGAVLAATGCERSPLFDELTPEGGEAQVVLNLNTNAIWDKTASKSSGLTPPQEQQVKVLEVLVFNSAQRLVSRNRITNPASNTITIPTKSGGQMSIFVVANTTMIANASGSENDVLGNANTMDSLKKIKITNLVIDVASNQTLVMSGAVENVTINQGSGNAITIPLHYVAAKVTVNLRSTLPAGESFELVDWKLGTLARYAYLFGQTNDAVNPLNAAEFITQSTGNAWSDGTIDVGGVATPVKTTTFYVFENRRGTTANTDAKFKSGPTAPIMATHFLARGFYKTAVAVKGIDIKVMLGTNSTNDYNVARKNQYIYNIEVKSFNDIAIDTRYEDALVGFQAELVNPTLDAHYDFRPIRIGAYGGTSTVTILDANGLPTTSTFWLKLSAKNITKFIDNGSGIYVRPTYTPATDMLQTLTYTHATGNSIDMQMRYLYADEFLTDNGVRVAKIEITNTSAATPITYIITQRGALSAGRVGMRVINTSNVQTATDYMLATEIFEEATMAITPGNLANERTSTMQWGYFGQTVLSLSDHTRRDGFDNTQNLVLSNISNGTLHPPYGRTGNTTITHQAYDPIYNTNGARYCFEKNRDVDGDGVIKGAEVKWYLPSPDEQLLIITGNASWSAAVADRWTAGNSYLSSSTYSSTEIMGARLSTGLTGTAPYNTPLYVRCVRQLPAPLPTSTSPYVETGTQAVNNSGFKATSLRPTPLTTPTPMHIESDPINATFPTRFAVAKNDVLGGSKSWAEANGLLATANSILSGGTISLIPLGCSVYFELGTLAGQWRLPTQREMNLIALVKLELLRDVPGFSALTGTYWCSTQNSATLAWTHTFSTSIMYPRAKTATYQVRCIRDL